LTKSIVIYSSTVKFSSLVDRTSVNTRLNVRIRDSTSSFNRYSHLIISQSEYPC